LDKVPQKDQGVERVCPKTTTIYTLETISLAGASQIHQVKVSVTPLKVLVWALRLNPPLDNVNLRLALDYAVNENAATATIFPNKDGQVVYAEAPALEKYSTLYDPQKAAGILAEAGYPKGEKLRRLLLEVDADDKRVVVLAEMMQKDLNSLGVHVVVVPPGQGDIYIVWK